MVKMSIYIFFYKILACQKLLLNSRCMRVKKSKTINNLDVKLVRNSGI